MFKELNSKRTIKEGIELKDLPFIKLKELEGTTLKVDGFFFTDGGYGRQVVVIANGYKVNMPSRAVGLFEDIKANDEMVKAILEGHLAIGNIRESKTKKGTTTLFELMDC